jgi:RNA polymerase sigma-70 factor (ECF subfamily)
MRMDVSEIAVEQTPRPLRMNEPQLRARHTVDPDAALVERLRRAEAGAVEGLVDTFGDRVYRLALRITGNASDAEEVVQDALWRASRKIDTFRGAAAFGSWLYRITANAAYEKLRGRRSKRNEVSWDDIAPSFDDKGQHAEVVAWSRKVGDPAIEGELRSVLGSAIDELPPSLRATFLLRDVEGLAYPQIAEILQVALATIKVRVHRARLFLRKRLTDYMRESVGVSEAGRYA